MCSLAHWQNTSSSLTYKTVCYILNYKTVRYILTRGEFSGPWTGEFSDQLNVDWRGESSGEWRM
jgi:hypothetical protein